MQHHTRCVLCTCKFVGSSESEKIYRCKKGLGGICENCTLAKTSAFTINRKWVFQFSILVANFLKSSLYFDFPRAHPQGTNLYVIL